MERPNHWVKTCAIMALSGVMAGSCFVSFAVLLHPKATVATRIAVLADRVETRQEGATVILERDKAVSASQSPPPSAEKKVAESVKKSTPNNAKSFANDATRPSMEAKSPQFARAPIEIVSPTHEPRDPPPGFDSVPEPSAPTVAAPQGNRCQTFNVNPHRSHPKSCGGVARQFWKPIPKPGESNSNPGHHATGETVSATHQSSESRSPKAASQISAARQVASGSNDDLQAPSRPAVTYAIGDTLEDTTVESDLATDNAESPEGVEPPRLAESTAIAGESRIVGWPLPATLMKELTEWRQHPATTLWTEAAETAIVRLNQLWIDDPSSVVILEYLIQLADQLHEYAMALPPAEYELAGGLSRLSYAVQRRAEVWKAVHFAALRNPTSVPSHDGEPVFRAISQRRAALDTSKVSGDWIDYLMLDRAAEVFASGESSETWRLATARKILARVSSSALTEEQSAWARQIIGDDLGMALRYAAITDLDPGRFLVDLEALEEGDSTVADARVNSHFQNFYWMLTPDVRLLSETFENHYRNANVRIEISERLVNSVIPRHTTLNQPVKDRILGAQVFGQSRIHNQLSVELVPDNQHLSFRLQSNGNVTSRTRAHASGFIFNSLGNAMVNASKGVSIGTDGVTVKPASVVADSRERLLGINSRLDDMPVMGAIARRVAEQQQQAQSPQTKMIVEQKLRNEFGGRVDEEIQQRLEAGRRWIDQRILAPLQAMELEPVPISLQTTAHSAVIRYRLAGLDQNAARSVRPEGLPGNLFNAQFHESAVNNLVNRIHINGQTFTADEFMRHIGELLGRPDVALAEGEQADVKFQFATRDALNMGFDENRVAITLKIKRLQIGESAGWKNLIVKAWYFPTPDGLRVKMILDEDRGVSLQGYRLNLRDQLAVRTVFNTIFRTQFEFPLLPADLASRPLARQVAVSQMILKDGWLGISVSARPQAATHRPLASPRSRQANYNGTQSLRGHWH